MMVNVIGNSSNNSDNKIDTSLFVQRYYLRANYIEADIEEDIDLKNQFRIKNLPDPISIREAASKNYVDSLFNNPSIIKNNAHIDLNDRNVTNARFIQVNQLLQIDSHLTAKLYVDTEVDQSSLVRNNQDNDFGNYNLTHINTITLNNQAKNDNQVITKAYVDQFHQENERSRRDVGLDFYDESNHLVKNKTNLDSITVNRNPSSDNELANKKYIDDELDKNSFLRFNQTLENYLKISVGTDTYNLTKYDKIQLIDVTEIRYPNIGITLIPKWRIKNLNKINGAKLGNFLKSTITNIPTIYSGATSLSPIGTAFMYIETSSNNHGSNVFVSWERTDIIQITNITLYYNRFSILTNDSLKSMGRFRIQLLLEDNTWSTQYTIAKNSQNSNTSTEWTQLNLDFTVENYGIRLVYDEIDTAHADMCFFQVLRSHNLYIKWII